MSTVFKTQKYPYISLNITTKESNSRVHMCNHIPNLQLLRGKKNNCEEEKGADFQAEKKRITTK